VPARSRSLAVRSWLQVAERAGEVAEVASAERLDACVVVAVERRDGVAASRRVRVGWRVEPQTEVELVHRPKWQGWYSRRGTEAGCAALLVFTAPRPPQSGNQGCGTRRGSGVSAPVSRRPTAQTLLPQRGRHRASIRGMDDTRDRTSGFPPHPCGIVLAATRGTADASSGLVLQAPRCRVRSPAGMMLTPHSLGRLLAGLDACLVGRTGGLGGRLEPGLAGLPLLAGLSLAGGVAHSRFIGTGSRPLDRRPAIFQRSDTASASHHRVRRERQGRRTPVGDGRCHKRQRRRTAARTSSARPCRAHSRRRTGLPAELGASRQRGVTVP
jgi:hypothetical protein